MNRCRVCLCVRKQDYHVFGNLEFDAETALLTAFMFKQISRSCSEIQGGRLTSKCKLSFNKRSPKSGWQGQTPLRPFIVYSFHLHNREIGAGGFTFKQFRISIILIYDSQAVWGGNPGSLPGSIVRLLSGKLPSRLDPHHQDLLHDWWQGREGDTELLHFTSQSFPIYQKLWNIWWVWRWSKVFTAFVPW